MRILLISLLLFIAFDCYSQEEKSVNNLNGVKDTLAVKVNGKLLVANAGFAPIPAFSFDNPLAIGFLSLKKKRFSYEPDFALGLNGKPWITNHWFRLIILKTSVIIVRTGINPFLFFESERIPSGDERIHVQRNITFELATEHQLSKKWSLTLTYRYNNGNDGGLSGHFYDASGSLSGIVISKMISIDLKPQLFYFDLTGKFDGLFTSGSIYILHQQLPISIYFQAVLPLWTSFEGNHFNWNTGLVYSF